jgi:hypothetical protein
MRGRTVPATSSAGTDATSRKRSARNWRFVVAAIILAGLAFQFWRSDPLALAALRRPTPGLLVIAVMTGTASYFLLLEAWRRLRGLREPWRDVGGVWFASLFARYAPGAVWQGAVRVGSAHIARESKRLVWERYLAEQALVCFSATTLALALVFSMALPVPPALPGALSIVAAGALASAIVAPRLGISLQWPLSAVLSMLGGHVLVALGFAALVASVSDTINVVEVASYMVMFLTAAVAGLIAIFAPAGIGVREAVLAGLLTPKFGVALAIAIAVAARVWLLGCEAIAIAVWRLVSRMHNASAGTTGHR